MLLSRTCRIRDSQWMELKKRRKSASPSKGKGYQSIIISRLEECCHEGFLAGTQRRHASANP